MRLNHLIFFILFSLAGCSSQQQEQSATYCLNGAGQAFSCGQPAPASLPVKELPSTQALLAMSKEARFWLQNQTGHPQSLTPTGAQSFTAQLAAIQTLPAHYPAYWSRLEQPLIRYAISARLIGIGAGIFETRAQAARLCKRIREASHDCLIYPLPAQVERLEVIQ